DRQRMLNKIDEFQTIYQPEINQHNQQWQNVWTWNQDVEILRTFARGRTAAVRDHYVESLPNVTGTSVVSLNSLPNEGGTIKISTITTKADNSSWQGTYFNGVEIPLQAIPNEGYQFVGWSANVGSSDQNATIILDGDVAITAIFTPINSGGEPLNQVINFLEIGDKTVEDTPFDLEVSASSGLPVDVVIISGPATLDGQTVTLSGEEGTVFIQASQAGNEFYNAATTVSRFFEVIAADTIIPPPPVNESYCTASGAMPWQEYIANVQFRNIDNPSSKDKYGDFTTQQATVSVGQSYPISLTAGFSWAHHEEVFSVWIDWNQDRIFDEASELVFQDTFFIGQNGTPASPIAGMINVPSDAKIGITRMRISMQREQAAVPCGTFDLGEVEDYSIEVTAEDIFNFSLICPEIINVTATETNGTIVEWEIPTATVACPEGLNTIVQTSGLPSGSFFPIGSSLVEYTATDNCGNATTCNFEIKVNLSSTYCASEGSEPWQEYIANVQLNTIDNSSFKEKYGDFTNITTTLEKGDEYEITLTPNFSFFQWDEAFQVWIDYDGNGSFAEEGELIFSGIYAAQAPNSTPSAVVGTFTVPETAASVNTRMRVSMQRGTPADACATFQLGEVEDYSVQLIDGTTADSRNKDFGVDNLTIFPNPAQEVLYIQASDLSGKSGRLQLLDAYGKVQKVIQIEDLPSDIWTVPVDDLVNGLYYLSIEVNQRKPIGRKVLISRLY
ncbi:MAG: GEVED domain-containing protein, partial [Bacteroidota bacterium]